MSRTAHLLTAASLTATLLSAAAFATATTAGPGGGSLVIGWD